MRDYLFYTSCSKGICESELFGPERLYDVVINDYTGSNTNPQEAEYKLSYDEWKYKQIYNRLKDVAFNYKAIAIFDDDIKVSTDDINKLFVLGDTSQFNIWQAALTKDSYSSWQHHYQKPNSHVRLTNTMEIMMPFFSQSALKTCWESFNLNYCAWGLDVAWTHLLKGQNIMVVDSIPVTHTRPMRGHTRIMPSGLPPYLEAEIVFKHYGIRPPKDIF